MFKIGQRVRLIRSLTHPHNIGQEYVIRGFVDLIEVPLELHRYAPFYDLGNRECASHPCLAPLTDPDTEWAADAVRKVTTLPAAPIELEPETLAEVTGGA